MIENISIGIFIHKGIKEECQILKNTYLKSFKHYLFYGNEEDLKYPVYTDKEYQLNDDYYSATPKQFLCLRKQFQLHNTCDWFFIAGYDTYLHAENAINMLSKYSLNEPCYIGGHGDIRYKDKNKYYFPSGGPGIFLNKKCIQFISENVDSYIKEWDTLYRQFTTPDGQPVHYGASELALAYFLKRDLKIACQEEPGFYFLPPSEYSTKPILKKDIHHKKYKLIDKPISFHRLVPLNPNLLSLHEAAVNKTFPFHE